MPWPNRSRLKSRRGKPDRRWSGRRIQGPRRCEDPLNQVLSFLPAVIRIGFPLHHFCCGAVEVNCERAKLCGALGSGNRNGDRTSGLGGKRIMSIVQPGTCRSAVAKRASRFAIGLAIRCSSVLPEPRRARWGGPVVTLSSRRRFASRKRVKQIIGPGIRHDRQSR